MFWRKPSLGCQVLFCSSQTFQLSLKLSALRDGCWHYPRRKARLHTFPCLQNQIMLLAPSPPCAFWALCCRCGFLWRVLTWLRHSKHMLSPLPAGWVKQLLQVWSAFFLLQCKGDVKAARYGLCVWSYSYLMGGFRAGRHWMSFFPSECILSQKMTETIVAIMSLKGEETWEGPKSCLCPALGTKYGLEQLTEAIAVRGLSLQYLGSITQKTLKQLGEVPVPPLRQVLAVSRGSSDTGALLCVHFLLGGCEGRSY